MATKKKMTKEWVLKQAGADNLTTSQSYSVRGAMDAWARVQFGNFLFWCKQTERSPEKMENWDLFIVELLEKEEEDEAGH